MMNGFSGFVRENFKYYLTSNAIRYANKILFLFLVESERKSDISQLLMLGMQIFLSGSLKINLISSPVTLPFTLLSTRYYI